MKQELLTEVLLEMREYVDNGQLKQLEKVMRHILFHYHITKENTQNTVKGSTVNRISIEDFPNFYIPLLERTEQDKIVKVLSAIDEKIDNNVNINDNLPLYSEMVA